MILVAVNGRLVVVVFLFVVVLPLVVVIAHFVVVYLLCVLRAWKIISILNGVAQKCVVKSVE